MSFPYAVLPLAILIGVMLGALGSGGAILALPILLYGAHLETRQAIAVSQLVVGCAALLGTLLRSLGGDVVWRQALLFGAVGVPASRLGAWVNQRVSPDVLMIFFSILVTAAGLRMLARASAEPSELPLDVPVSIATGLVVGFLTGMLGVGGGFLLVPSLISFGGLSAKKATATSLPVIAANSLSGAVAHSSLWLPQWPLAVGFLAATLAGTFLGLRVGRQASELKLKQALGAVLILVGIGVGAMNLWRA
jgi:uncharacterized protein